MMARASNISIEVKSTSLDVTCCASPRIITDARGLLVCAACGTCSGPEFVSDPPRVFDFEQRNARWHYAPLVKGEKRELARSLTSPGSSPARQFQWHRMAMLQSQASTRDSRLDKRDWIMISSIASRLGLSAIACIDAGRVQAKARALRLILGHDARDFAAASIAAVARIHGIPLTLHDIASAAGRPIDRLYIAWKLVKREVLPALHVPLPPVLIQALVQRRAGEMKLPWDHVTRLLVAGYTLDNRKLPTVLVGKSPLAIVAALVYLEVPKMTQLEIAKACGVTEVSIRNLVKIVEPLGLVMEGNGDKMK